MKPAVLFALAAPFIARAAEIPAVTAAMKPFVESGAAAGVVTLVTDAEKTLHLSSTGMADLETARGMRTDDLFWIASMTKPVTATAVMILQDEGELAGKRYVSPESVKLMTTVQSGDLQTGFTPGCAWGLGWCVVREPQGVSAPLSPGTFGHGGMFGTQAWIDPVKKRAHILLIQRAGLPNSDGSDIRKAFHQAAAAL